MNPLTSPRYLKELPYGMDLTQQEPGQNFIDENILQKIMQKAVTRRCHLEIDRV